jgi:hypothetical protein
MRSDRAAKVRYQHGGLGRACERSIAAIRVITALIDSDEWKAEINNEI